MLYFCNKYAKMNIIELKNMEFHAYHGHFPIENEIGGRYIVSLRLKVDCTMAGKTDKLSDALNYQLAYNAVKLEMEQNSALIEHLCARILKAVKKLPLVDGAWVKVSKMNPPISASIESVSVEMEA